jgi:hypothetical protein
MENGTTTEETPTTARRAAYWVTTILTALCLVPGGVFHLIRAEQAVQGLAALGYPVHFTTILATGKLLGAAVILAPRLPRAKEWAYAGIAINLSAASYAHVAHGDPLGNVIIPLVILALAAASWALRPASRVLGGPLLAPASRSPIREAAKAAA